MTLRFQADLNSQRTSGAARVSAVWLIVLAVLFLVSIAFAFITQSDNTAISDRNVELVASNSNLDAKAIEATVERRGASSVLGFFPDGAADPNSNIDDAEAGLARLRSGFPNHLGESDATYESVITKVTGAYNARGTTITELETQIAALNTELASARTAATATASQKDDTIQTLTTQISDDKQNADSRQSDLEGRLSASQEQTSERDGELRDERSTWNVSRRGLEQEIARQKVQISELARTLRFTKEPFANQPDGAVLTVSDSQPYGWINIGANQRLTTGTRFRVEAGSPGMRRFKAWAEVTSVDANRAQVLFSDLADRFDPVAGGDVVINPLFDPTGTRNAVLAGRFTGTYTRDELGVLLQRVGINVQDELSLTTHFLIVGQELYQDENGEPLEDPIQVEDLPVYKQAADQSVQIIPLQDLNAFFGTGS
ncbi:MAG: hypothetical protein ACI8PQ_001090 [Planctomycetota bacterium]|jgi:hypothetical protein